MRGTIALDARYAARPIRRGIGNYIYRLIDSYRRLCPDVPFLLYLDPQGQADRLGVLPPSWRVRTLPVANPLLWEEVGLPRALREDRPALAHLPANYGPWRSPVPTVLTLLDVIEFRKPWTARLNPKYALGWALRKRSLRTLLPRLDALVTISDVSLRDIASCFPLLPHQWVIPLAPWDLEPAADREAVRAFLRSEGFPIGERFVLHLGAIDPRKATGFALEVMGRLVREESGLSGIVVGLEKNRPSPKGVWTFGYVEDRILAKLMIAADVLLYPSTYEGFGLPVLDAMAVGTPTLVTEGTAAAEAGGQAAVALPLAEDAWTEAALALLRERARWERVSQDGLVWSRHFSWERTARETLRVYETVLGERMWSAPR